MSKTKAVLLYYAFSAWSYSKPHLYIYITYEIILSETFKEGNFKNIFIRLFLINLKKYNHENFYFDWRMENQVSNSVYEHPGYLYYSEK